MNSLLYYLLQVVMASGILYLYYHLALRNKKFHQYNRFYLLGAIIISILVPFLNIPVYFTQQETQSSFVLQTLTVISSPISSPDIIEQVADGAPVRETFDPANLLYYGYVLLALLALLKITFSLLRIRSLKKNNPVEKTDTISFINTTEPGTPFSFFRWLFWNKKIELRSEKGEQIFRHELFHIQQKHSIDLLFIELLTVVFWINPFFHIMKKELRAIHEFLADQFAVNKSNKWDYAELLLMQALQTKYSLVNPFFHNQIKRRIAMITNPEKTSFRYLRKLLVLPVTVLIITAFAFKYKHADADTIISPVDPITVIIDAGHGGIDPGAKSPDNKFNEAQISLELAKKIQELSSEYNVKVVLTREADVLPGAAANSNDGNRNRVKIADEVKPAAFIGIHINSAMKRSNSGIEAYVSATRDDKGGRKIASAILQELSTIYKTANELKMRKYTGIHVLDKNTCPAVILQCGYITNPEDLAFITDKSNQEKIARRILAALSRHDNYTAEVSRVLSPDIDKQQSQRAQQDTDKLIFQKVEIEATYPGGEKAWRAFLEKNLDADVPFKNGAKPGKYAVLVQFVVDKDGKGSEYKALTNHGYGMEQESLKCIKKVEKWVPAIHNDRRVNSIKKMPFVYHITASEKNTSLQANNSLSDVMATVSSEVTGIPPGQKTTKLLDHVIITGHSLK